MSYNTLVSLSRLMKTGFRVQH